MRVNTPVIESVTFQIGPSRWVTCLKNQETEIIESLNRAGIRIYRNRCEECGECHGQH